MAYPIAPAMPGHSGDRATLGQLRLRGGCRRPKRDADPPDFGCQSRSRPQLLDIPASSRPGPFETVEAQAVPCVGQAIDAAEHRGDVPEACASGNQEHDQDLVFDRFTGSYTAEDLTRHHAG